jgi:hypothetical protein
VIFGALYLVILVACILLDIERGARKPLLIVSFPLLVLDCLANGLVFWQSPNSTMSAEVWHHRDHKYWWWCHRFVDWLFFWQKAHSEHQALREETYGGFWNALRWDWKTARWI